MRIKLIAKLMNLKNELGTNYRLKLIDLLLEFIKLLDFVEVDRKAYNRITGCENSSVCIIEDKLYYINDADNMEIRIISALLNFKFGVYSLYADKDMNKVMNDNLIARVRMLYTLDMIELDFEVLEDIRKVFSYFETDEERVDKLVKTISNSNYYASLELLDLRTLYLYVSTWKEYKYLEKYDCFNDLTIYKITHKIPTYVYTYYSINSYKLEYEVYAYEKSLVGLAHEKVQEYTTCKHILEELS